MDEYRERLAGVLLGTALGDALGLPVEGLSARAIARRHGRVDRFLLLGGRGFVSDDTEQSALVAQSLARHPGDPERAVRAFRRSLLGWFLRLPWGIGLATLRACLRILVGFRRSGVSSAGNGAAMRAAVVGVALRDDPSVRAVVGRALAEVTHTDSRAVDGALYVAELAAACARADEGVDRFALVETARSAIADPQLATAIDLARDLARRGEDTAVAASTLGTTGFVVHTVPFATFCFLRPAPSFSVALADAIAAGGDTDSIGAVLGGWLGALAGERALPDDLIARLAGGPFGPHHLRALADALAERRQPPSYSALAAMVRNVALFPVVLLHALWGLRR